MMTYMSMFDESYIYPTVRLKKAILKNFKSVREGIVVFNCGKQFIPYGTDSDILGIYGQNGSGKTAFIEALAILKCSITGAPVPDCYTDCIAIDSEKAELEFSFDFQYPDNSVWTVVYSFTISKKSLNDADKTERSKDIPEGYSLPEDDCKVCISNELLKVVNTSGTKHNRLTPVMDTREDNPYSPFASDAKRKEIIGRWSKEKAELGVIKELAAESSRSFLFHEKTLSTLYNAGHDNQFFRILAELNYYGMYFFYVIDTKSTGFIRLNMAAPIYTRQRKYLFGTTSTEIIPNSALPNVRNQLEAISVVLTQIVPGLTIGLKDIAARKTKSKSDATEVMLCAYRKGQELPLRDESDGVRKIISILALYTAAYNSQSCTVAIDELDAGIYEYLLGELLEIFEQSGRGQLIFTSHNLRPLEVINKKFVIFTTANANNRYQRLKNLGSSNNLRDCYYREIVVGEQDEVFYERTKRHNITKALRLAFQIEGAEHE